MKCQQTLLSSKNNLYTNLELDGKIQDINFGSVSAIELINLKSGVNLILDNRSLAKVRNVLY